VNKLTLKKLAAVAGIAFALFLTIPAACDAKPELLDRIVAVVDDEVILWSELTLRTQMDLQQQQRNPAYLNQIQLQGEMQRILEDMVDERVVVLKALEDSIEIDNQQVEDMLAAEWRRVRDQVSKLEFAMMLEKSGMSERQLRATYRKQIRDRMLYDQMVQKVAYSHFITRRDVDEFRARYTESLPSRFSVSQINVRVTPDESVREVALQQMTQIQNLLAQGESFADLAIAHSQDPGSAGSGGDLGCFSSGTMIPEFERAAAELRPGHVSEPVLTSFGYHLIQLHEKREEELCASHILLQLKATGDDRERALSVLRDLRQRAMEGDDFAQLARDHSEDPNSARQGGLWQVLERENLPPIVQPYIRHLGLGDVSEPFVLETGGHILKINDDYSTLESLVREEMVDVRMEEVIGEYRTLIHVEERLEQEWLWDPLTARTTSPVEGS
jgi:peptidyl-prolyl cis-trans isomerase SurA